MPTPSIIYTYTDEAPALATHSLLPIVQAFTRAAGVPVERRDISLAGRILAAFPDRLPADRRQSDDLAEKPQQQTVQGGWFAAIQHHFLGAAVPPGDVPFRYDAKTSGQAFILSALGPIVDVSSAMPLNTTFTLFVGPKLQAQLQSVGSDLERTVDYGITTPLAQPLFTVLA